MSYQIALGVDHNSPLDQLIALGIQQAKQRGRVRLPAATPEYLKEDVKTIFRLANKKIIRASLNGGLATYNFVSSDISHDDVKVLKDMSMRKTPERPASVHDLCIMDNGHVVLAYRNGLASRYNP